MFEHFRNLFKKKDDPPSERQSAERALPAVDLSHIGPPVDGDVEELDSLYRQALSAIDAVESTCEGFAEGWPAEDAADAAQTATANSTEPAIAADSRRRDSDRSSDGGATSPGPPASPQQILEAALFVGGVELTLKKLCNLLQDEFPPERVEEFLDDLSERYAVEGRPYEIRFGQGGYRLTLRDEFDAVCNRVFGLGPKEVKLSQDALEVLSLVAYQQPVGDERVQELRGGNSAGVLRQLLRRELISLERIDGDHRAVQYRTTPRFLQVFGLTSLDDLPQADELAFK